MASMSQLKLFETLKTFSIEIQFKIDIAYVANDFNRIENHIWNNW